MQFVVYIICMSYVYIFIYVEIRKRTFIFTKAVSGFLCINGQFQSTSCLGLNLEGLFPSVLVPVMMEMVYTPED